MPGTGKSNKKTDSPIMGKAIPISDVGFRVNSVELKDFDTGRVFWTSTDPEEIFMQTEPVERKVKVIYYRQLTTVCKRSLQMF